MKTESNANGHGSFLDVSRDNCFEEDAVDPVYKLFLEHLRIDGRSYILEMEDGDNGLPVYLKYENEDSLSDFLRLDGQVSVRYNSFARKGKYKRKRRRICKKSKQQSREIVGLPGFRKSQIEKGLAFESYGELMSAENMPQLNGSADLPVPLKDQVESNLADDSYLEFLRCLKVQDGLMVMKYNSITIIYEGKGEVATDENPATEGTTCSGSRELVLYEDPLSPDVAIYEDDKSMVAFDSCILSSFDLKLMAVLGKPYDQYEHEALWKQANYRKPVLRHKDLRSQCKSFSTRQMGFSYLDHFPELARKLELSEPQEALVLLRGLFFWLKNLCHEGAYQPWISAGPQIVEVLDHDLVLPVEQQEVEIETLLSPLAL